MTDFSALIPLHIMFVRNVVARILASRCPDDINDVVQEAWLRAWRGWASFRGDCAVRSWLYRIAENCALYHLRHLRQDTSLEALVQNNIETGVPLPHSFSCRDSRTESTPEILTALDELRRLKPRDREAIELRFFDELDYPTIAAMYGKQTVTIKSRVGRGLRRMRERMERREGV